MKKSITAVFLALTLLGVGGLSACSKGDTKKATQPAAKSEQKAEPAKSEGGAASAGGSQEGTKGEAEAADPNLEASISVQVEESWLPHYRAAAERVKQLYPKAEIKFLTVPSFDHLDTIDQTDATNPDVADVFAIPADRLVGLAEKDVLGALPAEQMAQKLGGFKNFNAGLGGNFKYDGDYLAFPYNIETLLSFINTKNAAAEGYTAETVYELTDMTEPQTMLLPVFDAWFGVALANAGNIELLGKDESGKLFSDLTLDWKDLPAEKQAIFEAFYQYWKLNFDANTALFDPEAGFGYIDEQFRSGGKGAIRLGGPWETQSNAKLADGGKDLGIAPISQMTVTGKPFRHWKGGWGLVINARIEEDQAKKTLALAMIEEIVNPKYAVELFKSTGKVLENVTAEEYEAGKLDDLDKEVIVAMIKSYQEAPFRPLFKEWGQVWDTWKNALLSWNAVKPANAEAAYSELQSAFKAMMQNFNK